MPFQPGTILDNKHRFDAVIGRGGFGYVYRAHEQLTDGGKLVRRAGPGGQRSGVGGG